MMAKCQKCNLWWTVSICTPKRYLNPYICPKCYIKEKGLSRPTKIAKVLKNKPVISIAYFNKIKI